MTVLLKVRQNVFIKYSLFNMIFGKIAIDYCLILLISYLGLRSAHSVYHLDADEDEDEWSE